MNVLQAELSRITAVAEHNLRQIDEDQSRTSVLAGGWSRRQVIGHLIDSASNNHQRFVRAALQERSLEFPGYEQDGWARVQSAQDAPWPLLITLFVSYNQYLAHVILHLPEDKMEVVCHIDGASMTLRELAQDYLRHLKHHLTQLGITGQS